MDRQTDIEADKQIDRQISINRETDGQTDR
jgi:hypothetical protein